MKRLTTLPILFGLLCSCGTPIRVEDLPAGSPDRAAIVWRLDNLCRLTGLRRVGPIVGCQKRTGSTGSSFYCRAFLEYDKEPVAYHVNLDEEKRVTSFRPVKMTLNCSLREDTLKGPKRMQLLRAVRKANATLGLGCFGTPTIQKAENYCVVTFLSMPEQMLKEAKRMGLPRYISFLVTESGKVFGVVRGT